jgi:orotidine-5'-phosphate decarboxylase
MPAEHSPIEDAQRIIVALDTPDRGQALELARELRPDVLWFKVGLELFTSSGPSVVEELRGLDARVFLDLKLHDIPNTVARAVEAIGRLGVGMTTLHAGGGRAMMEAARTARQGDELHLLAVTVLTSLDADALRGVGIGATPEEQALHLARLAMECGMDGAVCSPVEVARLRAAAGDGFLLVTPGIRAAQDTQDDQARVAGPAEALRRGADYLVVGRPITKATDPLAAARSIQQALNRDPA